MLGSVSNSNADPGIDFLGIADDQGVSRIAAVSLVLRDDDDFGFAVDNLRFGTVEGSPSSQEVAAPGTLSLFIAALLAVSAGLRHRHARP